VGAPGEGLSFPFETSTSAVGEADLRIAGGAAAAQAPEAGGAVAREDDGRDVWQGGEGGDER
jgi:hypothetical protein